MEINDQILAALGVSNMQVRVYLAALELGEATMQALARKSEVNRSTIYTFIDDLKARGFILEGRRHKRNVYSATAPEALVDMQKSRVHELERLLPQLQAINNKSNKKPRVTFYEGFTGIEEVYKDQLRDKKEIVAYEDLEDLYGQLPEHLFE